MKIFKNIYQLVVFSFSIVFVFGIGLTSCEKEYVKNAYTAQEKRIDQFVEDSMKDNPDYEVVKNGKITKLIVEQGSGESINKNSTITFNYTAYLFPSRRLEKSNILSTNIKEVAEEAKLELSDDDIFELTPQKVKDADFLEGLYLGLLGMKEGEKAYILFSGKYGYGEAKVGTIPYYSALAYDIRIVSVEN